MEPDPRHPRYIKTVYGAGYCLELPSDGSSANTIETANWSKPNSNWVREL